MATVTRNPVADTYNNANSRDTVYGSETILRTQYGAGVFTYTLLKFDITTPPAYTTVFLRLYLVGAYDASQTGLHQVDMYLGDWDESTMAYNQDGLTYHDIDYYPEFYPPTAVGRTVDIDVTPYVQNAIGLGLTRLTLNVAKVEYAPGAAYYYDFGSRESAHPPELIFNTESTLPTDYFATASMSVAKPYMRARPFPYANVEIPDVPSGQIARWATWDSYLISPSTDGSVCQSEYTLRVQSGVHGKQTALVSFNVDNISYLWTASIRLCCLDANSYEDHMVIHAYPTSLTYNDVDVYASIPATLGMIEFDITPIIKNAICDTFRQVGTPVTIAIDLYDQNPDLDQSIVFASMDAPIDFTPHIILDQTVRNDEQTLVYVDADAYISSDRQVQTAHDFPLFPIINHDVETMPIQAASPYAGVYLKFDLDEIAGTIKTGTLTFTVLADSNFAGIGVYNLSVTGVAAPFDKETVGYPAEYRPEYTDGNLHNENGVTVTCPVVARAGEFDVSVDVTAILHRSLYDNGILFFVGPDLVHTPTNACLVIGGRLNSGGGWLDLVLEPRQPQPVPVVSEINGTAIVRCEQDTKGSVPYRGWGTGGTPEVPESAIYTFDLTDVPTDIYPMLELAVLWLPYIGLENIDPAHVVMYAWAPIHWSMEVDDPLGNNLYTTAVFGAPGTYHSPNKALIQKPYYMQFDLMEVFANYDFYSALATLETKLVQIAADSADLDYNQVRIGTREGNYSAYMYLQWKTQEGSLLYYVHGDTGHDDRDGLTPSSAWRTLDHAAANVPEGHTLYIIGSYDNYYSEFTMPGNFDDEPPNNRIAPAANNVTYKLLSLPAPDHTGDLQNVMAEINPNYSDVIVPSAATVTANYEYTETPGMYTIKNVYAADMSDDLYVRLNLFFALGTVPVVSAVLRLYIESNTTTHVTPSSHTVRVTLLGTVYYTDVPVGPKVGELEYPSKFWLGIDVTTLINNSALPESTGLQIEFVHAVDDKTILTPVETDPVHAPHLVVATDPNLKRTPGY